MLEHFSYCPRQCALIHLDDSYEENIYTLRGRHAHAVVHEAGCEHRGDLRIERGTPLWSDRLGLVGKADVVEFRRGVPFPVEYKVGKRRPDRHADLQLCAQALCLEEMLGREVPEGAVYHVGSRRRRPVEFTAALRGRVVETCDEIRAMLARTGLPPPIDDGRCRHCSLRRSCLPDVLSRRDRLAKLARSLYADFPHEEE